MGEKLRLDVALTELGLAPSRSAAQALIMSGQVYLGEVKAQKAGQIVPEGVVPQVRQGLKYVSRGGLKLEKALDVFGVDPAGLSCIDCGASTGGFTDCLLQRGAERVISVDVGYGQLAWQLRQDPRVTVMERTNVRLLTPEMLPYVPSLAVMDLSFISLRLVLPVVKGLLSGMGRLICLVKPQFEAGREKVGKKGVVRDPAVRLEVLENFLSYSREAGFVPAGLDFSPIRGPEGNIEFIALLSLSPEDERYLDPAPVVLAASESLEGK
jgi:23S rRNA (cytidine1920-2'-O)/16S rRNA (cytidine1409-2'-O)-methyltransferase